MTAPEYAGHQLSGQKTDSPRQRSADMQWLLVTDGYRHMQVRKAKTDRIDAEVVAKVLRLGEYQETAIPDEDILGIRQLCRYRLWLVSSCSDLKRKIIALLNQVFPEYGHLFSDVFGMASKELLKAYATPEEMLSVSTRKLQPASGENLQRSL